MSPEEIKNLEGLVKYCNSNDCTRCAIKLLCGFESSEEKLQKIIRYNRWKKLDKLLS